MIRLPLVTDRCRIRMLGPDDLDRLVATRNLPDVARFQDYDLPYSDERGRNLVEAMDELTGPVPGRGVQLAIERQGDPRMIGDLYVHLSSDSGPHGGIAEIGYTIHPEHQGVGIATEVVSALIDALVAAGIHRFTARLSTENLASARVLEHVGFAYSGVTSLSCFVHGAWEDDLTYSMTADERRAWLDPARLVAPETVRLVELDHASSAMYAQLTTHWSQRRFVAPMEKSLREALFPPTEEGVSVVPWMRGIEADGEAVGFILLSAPIPPQPMPYLWRFLVDRRHQGRDIGRRALVELMTILRAEGHPRLLLSYTPGIGSPRGFYEKLGFVATGAMNDDEIEMGIDLT